MSLFYLTLQFSKSGLQLWLVARLHVEFILDTMSQHMIVIHTFLVSGRGFSSTRVQVAQCKTPTVPCLPLCVSIQAVQMTSCTRGRAAAPLSTEWMTPRSFAPHAMPFPCWVTHTPKNTCRLKSVWKISV